MKDLLLSSILDIVTVLIIVFLGNIIMYSNGFIFNMILGITMYFVIDLHVYLSNKLNNINNIFYK